MTLESQGLHGSKAIFQQQLDAVNFVELSPVYDCLLGRRWVFKTILYVITYQEKARAGEQKPPHLRLRRERDARPIELPIPGKRDAQTTYQEGDRLFDKVCDH